MAVDPKSLPCPTCRAKPGGPCRRPSGHNVFGGGFHAARIKAYGQILGCPTVVEVTEP